MIPIRRYRPTGVIIWNIVTDYDTRVNVAYQYADELLRFRMKEVIVEQQA